ncbi:MAG: site-specific recombinase resolvase [Candidatus Nitricoxidivorans perseverans]|uniref:Site-specific recombinase resolvase n=1 Tax=Candidatus Nitricoxidivorans perseverans TaxID=2975601 RepID=A0AA49FNH2_9PROT|nr:MAG: site-specific recombinase resolvase [Candidatus Nitricoxidivorans perseverans]
MKLLQDGQSHERRHPLEDGAVRLTTFVPLRFKKRGIKKVVVGPAGIADPVSINAAQAVPPHHDTFLVKTLARCHYWQHLLDTGAVANTAAIAEKEGLSKVTVNETLRLVSLAPDIVEATLTGTLPRTASRYLFLRAAPPLDWEEQRRMVAGYGSDG